MLENLLGNAWKFTKNQPHPRIEFGLLKHGDTPTYYVRDNGIGFEMAYVDKLLERQRLRSVSEYEGYRDRTGHGAAHHPPARRPSVGRRRGRKGSHLLLYPLAYCTPIWRR